MSDLPICSIEGCGKKACNGRGWCWAHYDKWRVYGDPNVGISRGFLRGTTGAFFNTAKSYEGDECLIWPYAKGSGGYAVVCIGGKTLLAHILMCEHANGPKPTSEHEAAHSCGKGYLGCIAKRHLRWATSKENNADKKIHGTQVLGERHHKAKLTERDVRGIRLLGDEGRTYVYIANLYGISESQAALVVKRKSWSWLDD